MFVCGQIVVVANARRIKKFCLTVTHPPNHGFLFLFDNVFMFWPKIKTLCVQVNLFALCWLYMAVHHWVSNYELQYTWSDSSFRSLAGVFYKMLVCLQAFKDMTNKQLTSRTLAWNKASASLRAVLSVVIPRESNSYKTEPDKQPPSCQI